MSNFACQNCGLTYDTQDELKNHQGKFCVGSNYEDMHKLDNRYNQLKAEKAQVAPPTKTEIKGYVAGSHQAEPVPMGLHDILGDDRFNHNSPDAKRHRQNLAQEPQDLLSKAEQLKIDRGIQRQLKADNEKDVLSLLQDLETKKEKELRAHIEKEEIYREIKNTDEQQLGYLAQQKKQELNKLAQEHEAVRLREKSYMDEISKMETSILEQERFFKQQRDSVVQEDPSVKAQKLREVKEKEMKLAAERAQQVSKVKVERERLERERQRIMDELEKNKNRKMNGSRGGFRENTAAKRVGSALSSGGYNPQRVQQLEPSLKDKLIADQVRLNNLKQQHQITRDHQLTDVDDVDVLDREMKNQPNFYDGLRNLKQTYEARSTPNKQRNLQAIQNRLEYEGGAMRGRTDKPPLPSKSIIMSPPRQTLAYGINNTQEDNLLGKLDDLEGLLLGGGNQSVAVNHMHELPERNFQGAPPRAPPPMPVGPQSGFQPSSYQPQQTPFFPEQQMLSQIPQVNQNAYASQGSSFAPPQMGFGQGTDVYPFSQPFADPAMAQLAGMMQSQENENKKLRDVLENFAKNTSTYDNLEQQLRSQDMEIKNMADGNLQAGMQPSQHLQNMSASPGEIDPHDPHDPHVVFPDEFAFRQNDQRADDLEVEERALMNLAAQEYDQLRVIQKLPKGSELYEYKLKQYKEVSRMRTEIEKVLQEQRLEKIQRDFKRQKDDEDRQLRHIQWMDQQKRSIVDGKVHQPQQPDYPAYQQQYQAPMQQNLKKTRDTMQEQEIFDLPAPTMGEAQALKPMPMTDIQDPSDGSLLVAYDVLFGIPRQIKQLQIVARTLTGKLPIGEPALLGPVGGEPDSINQMLNKILYNQKQILPRNILQKPLRLILELQAPDPQQSAGVAGAGWTFFDLFHDKDVTKPAVGSWKLPVYSGLTSPDAVTTGGKGLIAAPFLALCIRVGEPGDVSLSGKADHNTVQNSYQVPRYHEQAYNQSVQKALIQEQNMQQQKQKVQHQQQQQKAPEQVEQRDPNYRNAGIRVRTNFILNKQAYKNLSLKLSVQDKRGQIVPDGKGQQCSKNLPAISDNAIQESKEGAQIKIDGGQAQVSQNGGVFTVLQDTLLRPFNNEIIFSRDFYKLFWDKQREPLILTAEIFAKLPGKSGPVPFAISQFEINDKEGKIRYGFFAEQLIQGVGNYIAGEFIGFTISDPSVEEPIAAVREPTPPQVNDVGLQLQKPPPQQQQLIQERPSAQRPYTGEISEQLIKHSKRQWNPKEVATLTEDIDIYIDGARHLPDNVTITRVTTKIVDTNFKDYQRPETILADIEESTLRNQNYNMKIEIRPNGNKLSPTSMLYISIETLDISNSQARVVGKTIHPLFVHSTKGEKRGMPIETEKATDGSFFMGNYQLGIYSVIPTTNPPFTFAKIMYNPRVPTATLLIRVMKAPIDKASGKAISMRQFPADEMDRAKVPPPDYKDGGYSNELLSITPAEQLALNVRRRRPNPPLQRVVDVLIFTSGLGPIDQISHEDLERHLMSMTNVTEKSALLDLNFHSQYEPSLGFRVSVEAIHDNNIKAFYGVLSSILPPASFYDPNREGGPKDIFTFTEPNFDDKASTSASYLLDSGDAVLKGHVAEKKGMSVLFDIKAYMPGKDQLVDYGFSVIPVLTTLNTDADENTNEFYVASGVFTLPVYKGKPSKDVVDILREHTSPIEELVRMQKGRQVEYLGTTSIVVKVVDSQREYHFGLRSIHQDPPSLKYIADPNQKKAYAFKPLSGGLFSGPVQLKELLPKQWKADREGFKLHLKKRFKEFIGLGRGNAQGEQQIGP